jgi:hypothetical protein
VKLKVTSVGVLQFIPSSWHMRAILALRRRAWEFRASAKPPAWLERHAQPVSRGRVEGMVFLEADRTDEDDDRCSTRRVPPCTPN